jgi:integrase
MSLGKQAKILTKQQQEAVLSYLTTTRNALRNKVIFLLSVRAGLRAKEIAGLTWAMVTDAENLVSDRISLQDIASKGKSGRVIWINKDLRSALEGLLTEQEEVQSAYRVIQSERVKVVSAQVIVNILWTWYRNLGFDNCSSHSGRRTFITNAAKKISLVGGSLRDVQALAGHSALTTTQRYIETDRDAMKRVVDLV